MFKKFEFANILINHVNLSMNQNCKETFFFKVQKTFPSIHRNLTFTNLRSRS